jgi:DNA-binding transcriptional MerR regulator
MNSHEFPKSNKIEAARLFNEQDIEETLNVLDKLDKAGMSDDKVSELIDWLTGLHEQNLEKREEAA